MHYRLNEVFQCFISFQILNSDILISRVLCFMYSIATFFFSSALQSVGRPTVNPISEEIQMENSRYWRPSPGTVSHQNIEKIV